MKTIIIYYSRTGNNRYIANKLRNDLSCDIEEIVPKVTGLIPLLFTTFFNLPAGLEPLKHNIKEYSRVILIGPIWLGKIIYPLYAFLKQHKKEINELNFITCCGTSHENRNSKFGHNLVFKKMKKVLKDKCKSCAAIPITLAIPEPERDNDDNIMSTRVTDLNFVDDFLNKYNIVLDSF